MHLLIHLTEELSVLKQKLHLYNTKTRKKELFIPLNNKYIGIYVCGPTVYGDVHLGNARPAIVFDVLYRYFLCLGYKVRYIRNITDVGHLTDDNDQGEDKILQKAKLEKLEPMEIAEKYIRLYRKNMADLNVLDPTIEPRATAHIVEQQEMIKEIMANGFAYEKKGSIYFDVKQFNKKHNYGKLSGRKIDDLLEYTRNLKGKDEKKNAIDFALWKNASENHIMRWHSPWGEGFPGWHLECSCMSQKYLGKEFDIHGGGLDLTFPHHECEIAQSVATNGKESVRYWMHNNLITVNGKKMSKSFGNFIPLNKLFTGGASQIEEAFHPMIVRFFILQAHYRSTLDFSERALQATKQGYERLLSYFDTFSEIKPSSTSTINLDEFEQNCFAYLNNDLNTALLIAYLFDGIKFINKVALQQESLTQEDISRMKKIYNTFIIDILGLELLSPETELTKSENFIDLLLKIRLQLKNEKNFQLADAIRNELAKLGVKIKDTSNGYTWKL